MNKSRKAVKLQRDKLRKHKHLFILNDAENNALNRYISQYRVSNKSKFIRETLMQAILKKFEEDTPTLFD
ncbi:MAG: hypothetical protein BGO29_06340 [Bacteroidales bacterium 36-12]|jgi:hypothetical protein|nr:MAG: hypothetical protein BGO29_06340 [Bacteroidales bacterium 36-12]